MIIDSLIAKKPDARHDQQIVTGFPIDRSQRVDDPFPTHHFVRRSDFDAVYRGSMHVEVDQRLQAVPRSGFDLGKRADQIVAARHDVFLKRNAPRLADDRNVVHHAFDHAKLARPRRGQPKIELKIRPDSISKAITLLRTHACILPSHMGVRSRAARRLRSGSVAQVPICRILAGTDMTGSSRHPIKICKKSDTYFLRSLLTCKIFDAYFLQGAREQPPKSTTG
ncbi:hypothetical protein [Bradyrhizobium sp. CCBAU 51753]|uniref:hypothetical protein n=1 Tax=Bradyrhizobium sp. CCBAU 51753 TaxID=1325100 RepID=UPI00188D07D4|nr:hypothetical protein [Bradyrhizobium sp. CCBAU 51753]